LVELGAETKKKRLSVGVVYNPQEYYALRRIVEMLEVINRF